MYRIPEDEFRRCPGYWLDIALANPFGCLQPPTSGDCNVGIVPVTLDTLPRLEDVRKLFM